MPRCQALARNFPIFRSYVGSWAHLGRWWRFGAKFCPSLADLLHGPSSAGEQLGGPKQVGHVPAGACPLRFLQPHLLWSINASDVVSFPGPRLHVAFGLAASLGGPQTTTQDGLGRTSIRVRRFASGTPENVCAQALIEAWCRVAPSDRRLLSARFSNGRPGPVLDATLPSSPVSCGGCLTHS